MHTLICVTFSLPPGVGGLLRLLLVALPERFFLPFSSVNDFDIIANSQNFIGKHVLMDCNTDKGSDLDDIKCNVWGSRCE